MSLEKDHDDIIIHLKQTIRTVGIFREEKQTFNVITATNSANEVKLLFVNFQKVQKVVFSLKNLNCNGLVMI